MSDIQMAPEDLQQVLTWRLGEGVSWQPLSGVAGTGAFRCVGGGQSIIVKAASSPRERLFYERYAPRLREAGVAIPDRYWSGQDSQGKHWLALEDIPHPYPQEEWSHHAPQLAVLLHLHACRDIPSELAADVVWYQPKWDDALTEQALHWFADAGKTGVAERLMAVQELAQVLFRPLCCLSGDPNPPIGAFIPMARWCCLTGSASAAATPP